MMEIVSSVFLQYSYGIKREFSHRTFVHSRTGTFAFPASEFLWDDSMCP